MPGVVSVFPNNRRRLHTTHSWDFMGLLGEETMEIPGYSTKNQVNVVIGFIDTGIWLESPSFSDAHMPPVPAKWKGECESGEGFNASTCNRKIIGARFYLSGYEAEEDPIKTMSFRSPRDSSGHGSHTASLKLQMYLLWVSVDEDEDIHKEYVEETNRQAIMIAAAKLIANDTVPEDYLGPEIVSHFVMHGTSVAEIVKHLIAVLKKKNDDVSNIFLEALKRAYHRHMMVVSESNDGSLAGKSFKECKDLAARLSGTFVGAARNKHRSDILKIVKDGIEYAFVDAPKQAVFFGWGCGPFCFQTSYT